MVFLKKEFYIPIISLIIGIITSTLMWDYLRLDYENDQEIYGEYSLNSHHSLNDTLRYIFFISFPLFLFFLSFFLIKKNSIYKSFSLEIFSLNFKLSNSKKKNKKNLLFLILITSILFILNSFNFGLVDLFEDGISLSGSTLFEYEFIPWVDVYINTGFIFDMALAKMSWILTGVKSIGSFIFLKQFLNFLTIILFIYFFYEISKSFQDQLISKNFFLITSLFLLSILDGVDIWRDLPLIIFLISILKFINCKKNYLILIICFLSIFTFFWSLDRGFFIFFLFIAFLIFILIDDKKEFLKFLITVFLIFLLLIIIIDKDIVKNLYLHSHDIFLNHEKLNGLIHPTPFSKDEHSTRATKSLLLIMFNILISSLFILRKKSFFENNTKFIFLFFSIMNFLIYKSALSRSDGPHIKEATYLTIILFLSFLIFFLIEYLSKKKWFMQNQKKIKYTYIIIFLIIIFQHKDHKNFFKFYENYQKFISYKNEKFLKEDYNVSIEYLINFFQDEKCLQAFSYDQAVFYLMDKKSCSKFYNVWVIGSKKNQLNYIEELEQQKPKYILKGGDIKFKKLEERYPYIDKYISNKYNFYKKIKSWRIYIKN